MKFPLRLTLDLWRHRLSQPFRNGERGGPIFHLPAALLPALHENGGNRVSGENGHSAAETVRTAAQTKAPVLWIGGGEPLDNSEVGRVVFALNAKRRNVFLHTNGQRLRQRIHEFHPDPRLFLAVELSGREAFHDQAAGRPGAFGRVMEGIRAAKLSGFHVCAHVTVTDKTEICETGELFEFLDRYDVDGYIVSSGRQTPAADTAALDEIEEIRALVRCGHWENFSRLLETSYASRRDQSDVAPASVVAEPESETDTVEETA